MTERGSYLQVSMDDACAEWLRARGYNPDHVRQGIADQIVSRDAKGEEFDLRTYAVGFVDALGWVKAYDAGVDLEPADPGA